MAFNPDVIWSKGENPEELWDQGSFITRLELDTDLMEQWSKDPVDEHKVPIIRASINERIELLVMLNK